MSSTPSALTCDVPQLKPDQSFTVPVDHFQRKVDPDRRAVVLREKLVHVSFDDAGFAHTQLPDHQHFEQVLLALGHGASGHGASFSPNCAELGSDASRDELELELELLLLGCTEGQGSPHAARIT